MEFKDIVSISGKSGLFELVKPRQDGVIVCPVGSKNRSFVSSRKHNFTPLENIGIYIDSGDTIELQKVFSLINKQDNVPLSTASAEELQEFFEEIIPNYDRDQVRNSDMKKVIQWHEILSPYQLFNSAEEEE